MANTVVLKRSAVTGRNPTTSDLALGELALNTYDGNLFFKKDNGTASIVTVVTLAGTQTLTNKTLASPNVTGSITFADGSVQPTAYTGPYAKVSSNTTAIPNKGYLANTGSGSFTITLPASPTTGQFVVIADDNAFGTNPLYVARNGEPIVNLNENLTLDITGVSVTLMYDGGSWNVYSQVGATGGSGSGTGTEYNFTSFPQSLIPDANNTRTLGNSSYKWAYVNTYGLRYGDNTTQTTGANADGSSITVNGGTFTAQAGGLAGNTLNSGVTASSLTSLGAQVQPIQWTTSGVNAPTFTSSSVGTKLLLYPAIASNQADYAIGIEAATLWNSVPVSSTDFYFKWYGGTTNVATLNGVGSLTLAGTLTISTNKVLTLGGSFTTSGSHTTTLTTTANTAVTLPTTGTLATLAGSETFTNKTLTTPVIANIKMGYTTTATAAGTTTLTASSNYRQLFTGTTTQTIVLPVTSTLVTGMSFEIENVSTGNLTVNSSGGNLVVTVLPGTCAHVLCIGTAATTAADWDADFISFSAVTGTGSAVLATSPTLVTPVLGTPQSGTLTNCTGLPVSGITASTATAIGVGSIELGHATDTTIARSAAGVVTIEGVEVVTLSRTQTLTNKTLTSPTLTTPVLGIPSSGTLTSCTGLPVSTGISGLGTGVATALAVNTGSAGAVVLFNGALGTPSSGTLTNATGLPVSGITASTSTALGVGSIELGHASDTTLSRSSAGVLAVEGVVVPTVSSTSTLTNKTLTSPTINAGALSGTFSGDHTLSGAVNITGALTLPNRPAFRVWGNGGAITATTTVTSTNWVLDYQQGSALNTTTGIFTAPIAGLYQVNLVIRTNSNTSGTITQAIVRKTAIADSSVTSQIMVEYAANTTMNHAGGSTITKMAVGDTLKLDVTVGTISFDGNDNWSVAFIG